MRAWIITTSAAARGARVGTSHVTHERWLLVDVDVVHGAVAVAVAVAVAEAVAVDGFAPLVSRHDRGEADEELRHWLQQRLVPPPVVHARTHALRYHFKLHVSRH
jgi:hypothetical protein